MTEPAVEAYLLVIPFSRRTLGLCENDARISAAQPDHWSGYGRVLFENPTRAIGVQSMEKCPLVGLVGFFHMRESTGVRKSFRGQAQQESDRGPEQDHADDELGELDDENDDHCRTSKPSRYDHGCWSL